MSRHTGLRVRTAAVLLAAFCLGPAQRERAVAGEHDPRAALREGRRLFDAEAYEQAAEAFLQAAEQAQTRGWDPAPAWMNFGHALHGADQFSEAQAAYRQAAQTEDRQRQARAYYNAGTTQARWGEQMAGAGHGPQALEVLERALEDFDIARQLAPDDEPARANRDWTEARIKEIKEQLERQPQPETEPGAEEAPCERQEEGAEDQPPPEGEPEPEDGPEHEPGQDHDQDRDPEDGEDPERSPEATPDPEDDEEGRAPDGDPEDRSEMTAEEALRILDALREQEEARRRELRLRLGPSEAVDKDW